MSFVSFICLGLSATHLPQIVLAKTGRDKPLLQNLSKLSVFRQL